MATKSETERLLEATEKNTHAVRALAFFFVSYFYQKLFGLILMGVGLVLVVSLPYNFIGWIPVVAGAAILLIFVFVSISRALRELTASLYDTN
jgi:hypothetical protein